MPSGQCPLAIFMTVAQLRAYILHKLTAALGVSEARAMERIITEEVMMLTPTQAFANPEREMPTFVVGKVQRIAEGVCAGEPLQYLLGTARFMGMTLEVNPSVLIPRPETETLVDMIVDRYASVSDLRVLDLGTGSGCMAIALKRALRFAAVTALDISPQALDTARRNARRLNADITFIEGDILALNTLGGEWDIIVSNPPYVLQSEEADMAARVKDHEPHRALFVPDSDPLRFYTPTIDYWRRHRAPGGSLWLEINPLCADMFDGATIERDQYGRKRYAIYG